MELIKTWALRIVLSSVVVGLVLILTPGGALEKSVKMVISLFMLFTIIYPFLDVSSIAEKFNFTDEIVSPDEVDSEYLIVEQLEKELAGNVKSLLEDNDLNVKSIDVNVKLTDNDEISVESLKVIVADSVEISAEEIKQLINDNCGLIAEVGVADEKQDE